VVSFTPRPLYSQGKIPRYPLDRRLSGPQSQSGCSGEEKNSRPLPGLEPPIIQPVAQRCTTELSRLLSIKSYKYKFKPNNSKRRFLAFTLVQCYYGLCFWVVAMCGDRLYCRCFREFCCLHLQGEMTKQWPLHMAYRYTGQ
jgi:hypothetical protein